MTSINPLSRPVQSAITPSFIPDTALPGNGQNTAAFRPTLGTGQLSSDSSSDTEPASERFSPVLFQQIHNLTNLPIVLLGNLAQQIGQIGKTTTTTTTTTTAAPETAPILLENTNNVVKENSKFSSSNSVNILSSASSPNPRDETAIPDSILTLLESFPSESDNTGRSSSVPAADSEVTSEDDPVKASASEVVSDISTDSNINTKHSSDITSMSDPVNTEMVKDKTVTPHLFGTFALPGFPTLPSPVQLLETLIPGISSVAKPALGNSVPLLSSTLMPDLGMETVGVPVLSPAETQAKTTETPETLSSSSETTQGPSKNVVFTLPISTISPDSSSQPSIIVLSSSEPSTVLVTSHPAFAGPTPMLENRPVSEPFINSMQNVSPTSSSNKDQPMINAPAKIDHTNVMTPVDVDDSHDGHTITTVGSGAQESLLQSSITSEEGTGKIIDTHTSLTLNTFDVTTPEKDINHLSHTGHTTVEQTLAAMESETELESDDAPAANAAIPLRPDSLAIEVADPASRGTAERVVGMVETTSTTSTGDHAMSTSDLTEHPMMISETAHGIANEGEMLTRSSLFTDLSRPEIATMKETETHSSSSPFPANGFIVSQPEMIQSSQQQQTSASSLFEETVAPREALFTIPESSRSLSSINPMPGTIIISQPVETGPFIVRRPKTMLGQQKTANNNQLQQQVSTSSRASAVPSRVLSMPYGMRVHHQAYVPAYQFGTSSGTASAAPSFDYRPTNPVASASQYMTHRMYSAPTAMSNSNINLPHQNSYTVQPPSQAHPTWSPYYSAYVYQ